MANKKKGQANKGVRQTPMGPVDATATSEAQPEADQLKTKAPEKRTSPAHPVAKGKNRGDAGVSLNKAPNAKEPMNKEKPKDSEKKSAADTVRDILQFLKEVNSERRKISWPGRDQVVRETWSVLVLVAIITGLVLGFDWLLGHLIFGPLEHWARLQGGGIGKG